MENPLKVLLLLISAWCGNLSAQQWDGLTLYSNMNSTAGYLIDTNNAVIKQWTFSGSTGYSTHMMPGGYIWRTVMNAGNSIMGGGVTGRIQKLDYNGNILWDYVYSSSTYVLHHDHCPLPNGNVLVISYEVHTASEVSAAGGTLSSSVQSDKIMELQPVGTNSAIVVWEWKAWDHLVQNVDPNKANYASSIVNNPQLLNINYKLQKDWMHMNGVDYNPALDQVTFSSHNLNEWYVIDHSTTTAQAASHSGGYSGKGGDILYRWGNPAAYGATGTKILNVTHDAHWIDEDCPNAGNLAGINNAGAVTTTTKTTADQIIIPRSGYSYSITAGSAFTPSSFSARKITTGYTTNMGNSNEFPNGNVMVCLATVGQILEMDPQGNVIWTKSTNGVTPQAHRYSTCYINNAAPPTPTITATSGSLLSCSAASSYQWYRNGDAVPGATLQAYTATQTGTYTVKTTDNNGCVYLFASAVSYTGGTAPPPPPPIDETGLPVNTLAAALLVYPNPTDGRISIQSGTNTTDLSVTVTELTGKQVYASQHENELDLSFLPAGLYVLRISSADGQSVNKKINIIK